jgi:ectoine hydroxylase-related dioxygenase (phytanoyl-CoA dioxygenase family)
MPQDQQYMQPWHQDWRSGQSSLNSITIWVPLHDVREENGAIDVMPQTHRWGLLQTEELSNPRRFLVNDPIIEGCQYFPAEIKQGESVAFSQMLVHRSGFNRTNQPRITVQLRFGDYAEPHFVARGLPVPAGSDLLWNPPPSEREMKQVFSL